MDITVVICTYNGATRLPAVLDRLIMQVDTLDASVDWEVIVVDNNSHDRTPEVIERYRASSAFPCRLAYVVESRQGLAFARRCGIQAAKGTLIAFLDDDNLPASDWVQAVYAFGKQYPTAGAYGSQIAGCYGATPPPNFDRIACFLAVIDRGDRPFRYDQLDRWLFPAGAGLVVRKQAWIQQVPDTPVLAGVSAQVLNEKGEDIETLSYLRKGGWPIWHNPNMKIEHVVERDRLTEGYLLKLFKGVGLSRHHTRTIRFRAWQKIPVVIAYGLKDSCKLLMHSIVHYNNRCSVFVVHNAKKRYFTTACFHHCIAFLR
ncbi:MAG: hormogonium polysaccharide biosynthesis glycosyltransferase HpsE [Cyanobacteria bacterium J06555_13]